MPRLLRLSLSGYRNLADVRLDIPPEGFALIGRNAQGKSNLLEAIYYLETLRSFRGARDEQLVRFGSDLFRIEAELEARGDTVGSPTGAQPTSTVAAAYSSATREKRIHVDGAIAARLGDAIGRVGAVLFAPDDLRLISGSPAERRRFLDVLLSLNSPRYLEALQRYRQTLHRRNATLRRGGGPAEVGAWDEILLKSGTEVTLARSRWVHEHAEAFRSFAQDISGTDVMWMRYDPSIPGVESENLPTPSTPSEGVRGSPGDAGIELSDHYREELARRREQERRLRTTLVGPHRDELTLLFQGDEGAREMREFGSGGQRRTAALTLRLLEASTIRSRRGREPVLLLDDIFAELDEDRSRRILRLLDSFDARQVILTAPKESDIRFREATLPRWSIRGGEIAR